MSELIHITEALSERQALDEIETLAYGILKSSSDHDREVIRLARLAFAYVNWNKVPRELRTRP